MGWSVRNINAHYGDKISLTDVTLEIEPGQIHGVIGGDGSGKSTLLKVLVGLDVGQTGTVELPSADRISFVPSAGGIFGDLTVDENVEFVAAAYNLNSWKGRAGELLERADLNKFATRISGRMSGGQRRKLAGCMALLPSPDLLVLDEVTTGVDPVSRMELWRLIAGAAATGTAVVVATTYLDEAERMGTVLLLHDGHTLGSGTPAAVTASTPGSIQNVTFPSDPETAWRKGRKWRQWLPAGEHSQQVSLEDAAIILELLETGANS